MSVIVTGKNGISAKIIADSIFNGKRITTFELVYHRFIHSEFMTHRVLSKNASSSRAVPLKFATNHVKETPAIPVHFGKNQAGMMSREEFTGEELEAMKQMWNVALTQATSIATVMDYHKPHKQWASRILEPYQMIKVVCTGTDWDNLLWLRHDEEAQPEFHELGYCIETALQQSVPTELRPGQWHLPYVEYKLFDLGYDDIEQRFFDADGNPLALDEAKKISASCCAQVSYRKLNDSKEKALDIYNKLFSGRKPHMSPTEHQATPIALNTVPFNPLSWADGITHVDRMGGLHSGNLSGWIQYRQTLPNNVFVKTS